MSATTTGSDETPVRELFSVVIRPRRSMSSRTLVITVICFTVLSLTIALSFLSVGLWLVLPFAGLEILVVGVVIGLSIRTGYDYESIVVEDKQVKIQIYRGRRLEEHRLQRYWTQVRFAPGASRLQPSRLWLGSHGRFVEFGRDMTDDAREQLAAQLKKAVLHGR